MSKVALVVGGTGMLTELSMELAKIYDIVGVIARTRTHLEAMVVKDPKIYPLRVDYTDTSTYTTTLTKFIAEYGKPELVVMWIHETGKEAAIITTEYVGRDLYQVTGSNGRETSHWSHKTQETASSLGLNYHRVILSSIKGQWLTNHDISDGVLQAVKSGKREYVVGD